MKEAISRQYEAEVYDEVEPTAKTQKLALLYMFTIYVKEYSTENHISIVSNIFLVMQLHLMANNTSVKLVIQRFEGKCPMLSCVQ